MAPRFSRESTVIPQGSSSSGAIDKPRFRRFNRLIRVVLGVVKAVEDSSETLEQCRDWSQRLTKDVKELKTMALEKHINMDSVANDAEVSTPVELSDELMMLDTEYWGLRDRLNDQKEADIVNAKAEKKLLRETQLLLSWYEALDVKSTRSQAWIRGAKPAGSVADRYPQNTPPWTPIETEEDATQNIFDLAFGDNAWQVDAASTPIRPLPSSSETYVHPLFDAVSSTSHDPPGSLSDMCGDSPSTLPPSQSLPVAVGA